MPILDYGFWKAKPVSYKVDGPDDRNPHINLIFKDDDADTWEAAINVKSRAHPSELVYWFDRDFSHRMSRALENHQPYGFKTLKSRNGSAHPLALDYLRLADLLHLQDGRLLPYDEDGPDNDILDQLRPILDDAISQQADIYLYGSRYDTGDGIHDVHMNQGSPGRRFKKDNGVHTDGGILFRFPHGHWEAVFLAFASQQIPTDEDGHPTRDSSSLSNILRARGRARL
ncbi:hypothetical protein A1O7_02359 [Cladophialophora yegresii CBS 114405]|uniref:DUF2278 domain-containing protein n=1 Tax=Cladophialophora yegresii CBS 114405 TaxID=1182544 RepID=W9W1W1_9EURO|nr:uncharacterized protein A1O7_02359 [Cladophialophora yegresii CBS 114405]EXJ61928.1 hypothetical protein A1O7_02359 [Cladophialophora yegresii CBS 114405]